MTLPDFLAVHRRRIGMGCLLLYVSVALVLPTPAQTAPPPLSAKAQSVRRKANSLAPRSHISVLPKKAQEEFGTFLASDAESFTFHDIDRKVDVTLRYEDVKKIKDGYGGYNHLNHKHVDREKQLIVVAVVVGGLVALIVAAAASK